jgi:DNA-binding transcriptional regulator YiaG
MSNDFKNLVASVEEEARQEGPAAVAEVHALRAQLAIGRQLRQLRRAHGLTQPKLAELTGIGQSEISKIERGVSNPTAETLRVLTEPLHARPLLVTDAGQVVGAESELALA